MLMPFLRNLNFDVGPLKTENGDGDEDKKAGDVGFSSENVWVNYK